MMGEKDDSVGLCLRTIPSDYSYVRRPTNLWLDHLWFASLLDSYTRLS